MGNKKTLDLEPIITRLCYRKTETLTETEIRQAIAEAILNFGVEYVTTLPTGNNIKQKVYMVPDNNPKTSNMCDIYIYDKTNSRWEHIDALKFNINDYTKIADIVDNLDSNVSNKPLSANQGKILKTLVDSKASNGHSHGSVTNDGKVGTAANKPLITGNNGVISVGSFGTGANTFCQGNDSRLSDARTPTSHAHGSLADEGTLNSDISNVNKIAVTDSSNNLKTISKLPLEKVTHQDISGKVNTSDIVDNLDSNDNSKVLSAKQGKILKGLISDGVDGIDSSKIDKSDIVDVLDNDSSHYPSCIAVNTGLNNKVDKVTGKGLSTNDYTTAEKNKLAGIESNANNYSHPSTKQCNAVIPDVSGKEDKSNKVTTLDTNSSHYPTCIAVNTGLSTKENTSNKVTTLNNSSTDFPSCSAVKSVTDTKLDKSQTSYKGKNVVVDSSTGNITFEDKNNHTHSQYLTSHQDISGKENISNKVTTLDTNSSHYPSCTAVNTGLATKADKNHTHDILDLVYPVGAIYISVASTDPHNLFGGTWQRIEGTFLLSSTNGQGVGTTGGSADAVVVKHTHDNTSHTHAGADGNYFLTSTGVSLNPRNDKENATNDNKGWYYVTADNSSGLQRKSNTASTTVSTPETGVDGTNANMPPYLVVNMWQRTK